MSFAETSALKLAARRSLIEQLKHERSLRIAAGLALAVAIPVATLFYFQFRSLSDLRKASTVVLRQLSQETADSTTGTLVDALRSPRTNVLLKIFQYQTEPLDLPFIEKTFDQGLNADPFVDALYVWSDVTDKFRQELLVFDRQTRRMVVNPPETALVVDRFKQLAPEQRAIAVFEAPLNGRRTYFLAQLRFTFPSRERMTSFVALRVDAERLRTDFIPQLMARKFAKVEAPLGFSLEVTVLDDKNRVIYPVGGAAQNGFVDERTFALVFYEPDLTQFAAPKDGKIEIWRLRTGFGALTIPEVVATRYRPQYAMMIVLGAVMTLGVFFVARATAREVRIARLLEVANLRTRIALDLHDDIGSNLTKISILSEVARQQQPGLESVDESLSEIARISRDSAAAMSDIVWAINPELDSLFDLLHRMRRHAEEMCVSLGLTLSFQGPAEDQVRLSNDVRRDLFLIFKEAINNVARHSRCAHVDVDVRMNGSSISVNIVDDGVGFDAVQRFDGAGLVGMRRRAEMHNGLCDVRSAPGRGTTVSVALPVVPSFA